MTGTKFPVIESPSVLYGWGTKHGTYRLDGKCWNCGQRCTLVYAQGQRTSALECPNCGCKEARPETVPS